MWQDIVRQVEQGGSRVLQAVDWPQSSPEGDKDHDSQSNAAETPPEDGSAREVCIAVRNTAKMKLGQARCRMSSALLRKAPGRHQGVVQVTSRPVVTCTTPAPHFACAVRVL